MGSTYADTLKLTSSWRENLHFYFPERFSAEITQPFNAENNLLKQIKILGSVLDVCFSCDIFS